MAGRWPNKTETDDMSDKFAILDDRAVIAVNGEDARSFLQGLVTAQLAGLQKGEAEHAGMLTPQGKILFDFFIVTVDDGFVLDVAADRRDQLVQRLTMYKLRAKVEITAIDDMKVGAGWPGDAIGGAFTDPRLEAMGWRIIGAEGEATASLDDYHAHRISLGIADSVDIGSGQIFPHEANFDQLGSVSFNKGCYVGQEVVSRMQHKTTVRSRIVPVSFSAKPQEVQLRAGGKRVGQMLSTIDGKGLALIRLDRAQTAIDNSQAIVAGQVEIRLVKPDWAKFDFPH